MPKKFAGKIAGKIAGNFFRSLFLKKYFEKGDLKKSIFIKKRIAFFKILF